MKPFLRALDLVARKGSRNIALGIEIRGSTKIIPNRSTFAALSMAALMLKDELRLPGKDIESMLLLVNIPARQELYEIADLEGVRLIELSRRELMALLEEEPIPADRRSTLARVLGDLYEAGAV